MVTYSIMMFVSTNHSGGWRIIPFPLKCYFEGGVWYFGGGMGSITPYFKVLGLC